MPAQKHLVHKYYESMAKQYRKKLQLYKCTVNHWFSAIKLRFAINTLNVRIVRIIGVELLTHTVVCSDTQSWGVESIEQTRSQQLSLKPFNAWQISSRPTGNRHSDVGTDTYLHCQHSDHKSTKDGSSGIDLVERSKLGSTPIEVGDP